MITRHYCLLVVTNEVLARLSFEAIQEITDLSKVFETWDDNKIPVVDELSFEKMIEKTDVEVKREKKLVSNVAELCAGNKVTEISISGKKIPVLYGPDYYFDNEAFIAWSHENGFECGEFMTGSKYNTFKDQCFLCDCGGHRINGKVVSGIMFNFLTPQISNLVIMETENFFVKIELGCMREGMLMVNPKEHILSAAAIADDKMEEYKQLLRDTEKLLKATYGDSIKVVFFEHGSAPDGISSHQRSIVHAHTHVAWLKNDEELEFFRGYMLKLCKPIKDLKELRGKKYMSYHEGADGEIYAVYGKKKYVQRQYPRQVYALMLGILGELYNWRKNPCMTEMKATFKSLYETLTTKIADARIIKQAEAFIYGYPMRNDK